MPGCLYQVFIEAAAGNPFREKRETRSLFAPKATRVLGIAPRAVASLEGDRLGGISRGRSGLGERSEAELLAREWAAEAPGGFRVTKPDAVLDVG